MTGVQKELKSNKDFIYLESDSADLKKTADFIESDEIIYDFLNIWVVI